LTPFFSPLERESLLVGDEFHTIEQRPEVIHYRDFLAASLRVLFERFWLQWSFAEYSVSSVGPAPIIDSIVNYHHGSKNMRVMRGLGLTRRVIGSNTVTRLILFFLSILTRS
jgi:hypothetical protein